MGMHNLKYFAIAATLGTALTGCKVLDEMVYTVTPCPVEMHADSVAFTVSAVVPENGLHKKASAEITAKMVWDGGEKALKPLTIKGPKAAGNGIVIDKAGKTVKLTDRVAYEAGMENCSIILTATGTKGSTTKTYTSDEICKGTIITPYLLMDDDKAILGKDNFQRVVAKKKEAIVHYSKNNSGVKNSEMRDQDIKDLKAFAVVAAADPKITLKSVDVPAYASPEGEISLNNNLANERAASAAKAIAKIFTSNNEELAFNEQGKGEDWNGFKKLVEASDIKDRQLIISVLEQYPSGEKREAEIRNLSKTFTELDKKILPQLRRSLIAVNYEQTGFSDEELMNYVKTNPDTLNVEEMLFAATLFNDLEEKMAIYQQVASQFENDWRGPNNVGYILLLQGKVAEAKTHFAKAASINETAEVSNNLGVCARLNGDNKTAMEHYGKAAGADPEVAYNEGIVAIKKGNYSAAVGKMSHFRTFNRALAEMLSGNPDGAANTLDASADKDSAMGYYLKAVIGARTKNNEMVINGLRSAIEKEASMKAKAKKDLEFLEYRSQSDFQGLTN